MVRPPSLPDTFPPAEAVVRRVDEFMRWVDFGVDVVPPSWDLELTVVKNGVEKIDHEAQHVLAFLLTCHSSRYGRPRFSGPAFNVSYAQLQARFRIATEKGVVALLKRMERDHGVLHRFSGGRGESKGAFLYLAPNVDRVEEITYPVLLDMKTFELRRWNAGDVVSGGPYSITSIRQHEADAAGISCSDDEENVHVISLRKGLVQHPLVPESPIDTGVRSTHPAYATSFPDEYADTSAGSTIHAGFDGSSRVFELGDGHSSTGPVGSLCPIEQNGTTGEVLVVLPEAFGPAIWRNEPTGPSLQTNAETPLRHSEVAPLPVVEAAPLLPFGVQGRTHINAQAQGTVDADLRLGHMLGLFRWVYERQLERARTPKARRAVVRAAWQVATRLLSSEVSSDKVRYAWERLERAGSADPALDLLGVAVLACGRCTGTVNERVQVAHALLDAVSRQSGTDAVDPEQPQDVAAVDRALRTALQHRLDRLSLARVVVHVCGFSGTSKTYAFVNGLVRHYETHEVPFNTALFAGALASVVRDHRTPTASDLVDACEREVRLYPASRVRAGDRVLFGTWSLSTDCFVSHESVVTLGTPPARGEDEDVWDTVEEVHYELGGLVARTDGGGVVSLNRAEVERKDDGWLYALAHRAQPVAR